MITGVSSSGQVGIAAVQTTSGRGATVEEVVERLLNKVISVSDTAPMPIREQAIAYREKLRSLFVVYGKQMVASDRTTLANKLRAAGYSELADNIHNL